VTQVVAIIMTPAEYATSGKKTEPAAPAMASSVSGNGAHAQQPAAQDVTASPIAARIASEKGLQLAWIKPAGGRVEKSDVLAYLADHAAPQPASRSDGKILASPKARRLALENGQDLAVLVGSGPAGAILAQDIKLRVSKPSGVPNPTMRVGSGAAPEPVVTSTLWRRMAEHTTASWVAAPHFYLHRTVRAARLLAWHARLPQDPQQKITITDLLVLIAARALANHPRINVVWQDGEIRVLTEISISLAVAVDDGLVVPVIHNADRLGPLEIAAERKELMARAQAGKLRVQDISGGSFTISNLGMYGVDSFDAVLNGPQAAILAVGRITEQVVPVNGVPAIEPVMHLSVSFDHRAVDGATGAKFLATLADMVEEPLLLMS
jgi:pyruvate dehydrogenase E2 component (dihydrolipoamide acetyltransferase)